MSRLVHWGRRVLRRHQVERHLADELGDHVNRLVTEHMRAGLTESAARRKAALEFGGLDQTKDACRDVRGTRWLETAAQDVRLALRALRRTPGPTVVILLTLALGIGANAAIFSFIDGVLLRPLPYPDANRIVRLRERLPQGGTSYTSTLNYLDWKAGSTAFEQLAALTDEFWPTLSDGDVPARLFELRVSPAYFEILGVHALLGRTFASGDDQPGNDHVAVLSHALWSSRFGSDPLVIGRSIRLDGESYTVVGVIAAESSLNRLHAQLWVPLAFDSTNTTRTLRWLGAVATLKRGVTLEQARAEMDAIGARLSRDFPDVNRDHGVVVDRLADVVVGSQLRVSLYVLFAAVGLVLLIGCANVANVMLARAISREREVAIRLALGAGRWRLVRQFVTESLVVSWCGAALGLALGYAMLAGLKVALPPFALPPEADVHMDLRVLVFTLMVSVVTGIAFGLVPAFRATQAHLAVAVKEGGRGVSGSPAHRRLRDALAVAEVALAFVLLTGAGLLLRSFLNMRQVEMGFDASHVLTAELPIWEHRFQNPAQLNEYLRQIVIRVASLPGAQQVALTSALPTQGWGWGLPFQVAHHPIVARATRPLGFFKIVTPSYFRVLRMRLRAGTLLDERDRAGAPRVCVINETMARRYLPAEDPVGKRLLVPELVAGAYGLGPEIAWEIVGIVADERVRALDDPKDDAGVYVTDDQSPTPFQKLVVRTSLDPSGLETALQKAISGVSKDQSVMDVKTLDQLKAESIVTDRARTTLLGVFAVTAALLATIGIYGVMSYSVMQRTQEIGIRAALGASVENLVGLIVREGLSLVGIGLVIGLGATMGVTRLLTTFLFGVGPMDRLTMAGAAVVMLTVAIGACYVPARRAGRADPLAALRYD